MNDIKKYKIKKDLDVIDKLQEELIYRLTPIARRYNNLYMAAILCEFAGELMRWYYNDHKNHKVTFDDFFKKMGPVIQKNIERGYHK